jgi:cephalosporin hydroxylase
MYQLVKSAYRTFVMPTVCRLFLRELILTTQDFADVKWLGRPIRQNVLDLWTIQETLVELKPSLLIECGTQRGGSALFYATLFDLMGAGHIISMDVQKLHDHTHPRVTFLIGSSVSPDIIEYVRAAVARTEGPVMVILDSDHSKGHVAKELEAYHRFVTPGSFLLVQDGVVDLLRLLKDYRPGPLPATLDFARRHPEFQIDQKKSNRFLVTHHPQGWLRRLV